MWSDPRVKPGPGEAEIDYSHRLGESLKGSYLFNERGGIWMYNEAHPISHFLADANTVGSWTAEGMKLAASPAGRVPVQGGHIDIKNVHGGGNDFSYWIRATVPDNTGGRPLVGRGLDGFGSGWNAWLGTATTDYVFYVVRLGSQYQANVGSLPTTDRVEDLGCSFLYAGSSISIYKDGTLNTTVTNNQPLRTSTYGLFMATPTIGNTVTHFLHVWDQARSKYEFDWLRAEPFAMFKPVMHREFFFPRAAFHAARTKVNVIAVPGRAD